VLDGRKVYEIMLELLDPKLVKMQFQMSSIRTVGDPVEYFKKYPGRFISLHLQDVDLNEAPPPPPAPPPAGAAPGAGGPGGGRGGRGQRAVGKGSIDWVKTFQAAKLGGVKNYFVEQNMDLTKESVAFLKTLKV
jgi:sugar phosphate isomerase/epimerase